MADHLRKQIRDAMVAAVTGLATTGTNAFGTRIHPVEAARLPAVLVYATEETSDTTTLGVDGTQQRITTFEVACVARKAAGVEDEIDQIALEVEQALHTSFAGGALAALVKRLELVTWEFEFDPEADQPLAAGILSYLAEYGTKESDPTTPI